jgi:hypothetical protein
MKLLLVLLFPVALAASPCDGNPRISNTVSMTCQVAALPLADSLIVQVRAQSANTQTVSTLVEIGWRTATSAGRLSRTLRVAAVPFDRSTTFAIPAGAIVEFVQVEENTRISSAGFIQ